MDDNTQDGILRTLGQIEGKLDQALPKLEALATRVSAIEKWQSYLKGAWAVLTVGFLYVIKFFSGRT